MPEIQMPDGHVYDVPDNEVELATSQGGVPAGVANPRAQGGGSPLAGAAGLGAQALDAIGGPRTLLFGGGGLGALYGARKLLGNRAPADASAAAPSNVPKNIATLTKADIKALGLKGYKPGQLIERKALDKLYRAAAKPEPPPRANVPRETSGKTPTRKIDVQGKPGARAPAPTENPRYTGGRGASGPELARRAAMLKGEPIPGTVAARLANEGAAARGMAAGASEVPLGSPDPELWRSRGISAPRGRFANALAPGSLGGGVANLALMLLNSATTQQQMDEAHRIIDEAMHPQASTRRALRGTEGI